MAPRATKAVDLDYRRGIVAAQSYIGLHGIDAAVRLLEITAAAGGDFYLNGVRRRPFFADGFAAAVRFHSYPRGA